jgi:hypothetical protein
MSELITLASEQERVENWRREVLVEAGYPLPIAAELACSDVDLHRAVDIVRRGCSHETAAAILL